MHGLAQDLLRQALPQDSKYTNTTYSRGGGSKPEAVNKLHSRVYFFAIWPQKLEQGLGLCYSFTYKKQP